MLKIMFILSIFLYPVICQCQNNKIEMFKKEIYETKNIAKQYTVIDIDSIHNDKIKNIYQDLINYNLKFKDILYQYFSNKYVKENFELKTKFNHEFLYLKGREYFNEFITLKKLEEDIENLLSKIIINNDKLARISIFFDNNRYFSKGFEIIEGFEAFNNIDHFRIFSANHGKILKDFDYGSNVSISEIREKIGYFENNISYQITIPHIFNNTYIADIKYTIYK